MGQSLGIVATCQYLCLAHLASLVERVYTRDLKPLQFKVRILDEALSYNGFVAPMVERVTEDHRVLGSTPSEATRVVS